MVDRKSIIQNISRFLQASSPRLVYEQAFVREPIADPPKPRVVIQQWDSLEKYQEYRNSAAFKELLPMREKAAKWRTFVVEAVATVAARGLGRGTKAPRPDPSPTVTSFALI
jgi:hypothetical protein